MTGYARWPAGAPAQSTSAALSPAAYSPAAAPAGTEAAAPAGTEAAVGIVAFGAAGTHSQVLGRTDMAESKVLGRADTAERSVP